MKVLGKGGQLTADFKCCSPKLTEMKSKADKSGPAWTTEDAIYKRSVKTQKMVE